MISSAGCREHMADYSYDAMGRLSSALGGGMSSVDACEAGRFSMYIDAEMNAYPCSFDNQLGKYRVSLENKQIEEIWNGVEFEHFRNIHLQKCNICKDSNICSYGCGLKLGIELC